MKIDFSDTTCVITGAAEGLGLGLARAFGARGARVGILDIRAEAASAAATELAGEGIDATPFECDVTDRDNVDTVAKQVDRAMGSVNLVWCNAGVGSTGGLSQIRQSTLDWIYAVNVQGTLNTYRAFTPLVRAATGLRHVGFTGSSNTLGHIPNAALATYAASKWAVVGIAEAAAGELAAENIGVTILCPGLLNTSIWDSAQARPQRFGGPRTQPWEVGERWRTFGAPVTWATDALIKAMDQGRLYCNPVETHTVIDFDTRTESVRAAMHTRPDAQPRA